MKSRLFSLLIILIIVSGKIFSQNLFYGKVVNYYTKLPIPDVNIYDVNKEFITATNHQGDFNFLSKQKKINLIFHKNGFEYRVVDLENDKLENIIFLKSFSIELSEVIILDKNDFTTTKLNDIVGNSIFAGKKTNKIILDNVSGNTAANSARHIYNKIGGLNIFQNDDAGLQLNIGGRGLNPSRSANFNIRQNNYDISADVLGYPESYYTPPAEALKEIQMVKGAASLQYGTQFGGLVNFVFKRPNPYRKVSVITRNTIGSDALYTNFTSLSGTIKNFAYYTFINYKNGDGFRKNSNFESLNLFAHFSFKISEKINSSFEITYLTYLAQQSGGLTDKMFNEDMFQSNRERNWFKIHWLLYNSKFLYNINRTSSLTLNLFALDASRFSLGYRQANVALPDPIIERDLIKGYFINYGFETKYLKKYSLLDKKSVFLSGFKYYKSQNESQQGPGSSEYGADFSFYIDEYQNYTNQSKYKYPNLNHALFFENIIYFDSSFSITPGMRFENIKTESIGNYRSVYLNLVNQPIFDTTVYTINNNKRQFILLGVGMSYKNSKNYEIYSNVSQNYRSVTFSDITITNPSFLIDPNIRDESGYTYDIGYRGVYNSFLRFDFNHFGLSYNDRIGFLQKTVETSPGFFVSKTQKSNIGNAFICGFESLLDIKLNNLLRNLSFGSYINYAYTNSKYLNSTSTSVVGKKVEFVPTHNIKAGIELSYKSLVNSLQLTYLSEQFTDASNSVDSDISGILGVIPSYYILDFSMSLKVKNYKIFSGVNNLLNNYYFTRRATGYPGPGIIPSPVRNYYITFEINI